MITYDIYSLSKKQIEDEQLLEVLSPRIFIREGEPDPYGLGSYDIFGLPGSEDRRKRYGFIRLNDLFIHPHVVFELKSIKRQYMDLINGNGTYVLENGSIELCNPKLDYTGKITGTGPKFLYKIWDSLDFEYKHLDYGSRYNRLRFLKTCNKSKVFMDKMIIIPAFYRDIDIKGERKNPINTMYIRIMNLANTIKQNSTMIGVFEDLSNAHRAIQQSLIDFHEEYVSMYGGRKGFIHKFIMGKAIDFSARLVISCTDPTEVESPEELKVDFGTSLLPLFAAVKCFAPFIVKGVADIVEGFIKGSDFVYRVNPATKVSERVKLASDWRDAIRPDVLYSLIELYHESPAHRLEFFSLPLEDGTEFYPYYNIIPVADRDDTLYDIKNLGNVEYKGKYKKIRLIELFYMAAVDTLDNKHIMVTRYPIEDHNNTYPSTVNIVPYKRTAGVAIGNKIYPEFPIVEDSDEDIVDSMFVDSLNIFQGYLKALTADFDGDQVSVIGLFTDEANNDAANHITSIANIVDISGGSSRSLGALIDHTIAALTYEY